MMFAPSAEILTFAVGAIEGPWRLSMEWAESEDPSNESHERMIVWPVFLTTPKTVTSWNSC